MCFMCFRLKLLFAKKQEWICITEYCLTEFFSSIIFVNFFIVLQTADQFLGKCDAKLLTTVA